MTLPLTKTFHPDDLVDLAPELVLVDQHFTAAREQHPARRFEYGMALRALSTWHATRESGALPQAVDVGGAGSPFWHMVLDQDPPIVAECLVMDPDQPSGFTLAQYLHRPRHAQMFQVVFCLSVLEHVEDLDQFLYHLSCLVAPGGLLFLTMDCWDQEGPDTAHFHWMRKRIFDPSTWQGVALSFTLGKFDLLGTSDWTYCGHQIYGSYSFASLALVKRP